MDALTQNTIFETKEEMFNPHLISYQGCTNSIASMGTKIVYLPIAATYPYLRLTKFSGEHEFF
jgi:hypothetical protein